MIDPGRTGMLFDAGSADQLRGCIETLWPNNSLVFEMGKDARRKVEEEYNEEVHYQGLTKAYKEVISERRRL